MSDENLTAEEIVAVLEMTTANPNRETQSSLAQAPGSDASPWPARDVVAKLAEAADILLDQHDYDGHGWELIHSARRVAKEWLGPNDADEP